ncbi:hypothetical protein GCM10007884_15530 [Methylobacterium brachythecii]|uniref:Uncharacterized protein n=1 Tax=Methylobacterium brachythecii TaxID=1176177 RepID=A0ABQ6D5M1_9HYPH|nr:hypothetical protein GCM10007884_15530 [Methylobacterium brachythecii]
MASASRQCERVWRQSVEGDGDEGEEPGEGQIAGEDENDDRHEEIGRFAKESGGGV